MSEARVGRRTRLRAVSAGLGLVLLLGAAAHPPEPVDAVWNDEETVTAAMSAATVQAPASVSCTPRGILLGTYAEVTWTAVTGAARYHVYARDPAGVAPAALVSTTESVSVDVNANLLNKLVGGLLDLLLGGDPAQLYVVTEHSSGWMSAPSPTVSVKRGGGLIGGLLGGVTCA